MIKHFEKNGFEHFLLKNDNLCCLMRMNSGKAELLHFGRPVTEDDAAALSVRPGPGWGTATMYKEGVCPDVLPLCWSESGTGDYRDSPVKVSVYGKPLSPDFVFEGYSLESGEMNCSLPRARGERESLCLSFVSGPLRLKLYFELFDTALVRRTELTNTGLSDLSVTALMSMMIDIKGDFTMTTLNGGWIAETHEHDTPVGYTKLVNESTTGFSSNRHNSAFMLCDGEECYGFNLIYSGNHYASAQRSHQGLTRVMQGINLDGQSIILKRGDTLCTPEAVLCYSGEGKNGLRQMMHGFVNKHIIPEYWQYRQRPVLYNNWEGCMFSFNEAKLLNLGKKAKSLGCELFVLDDGWFGARNSDTAGLGDYNVNTKKLPGGLKRRSERLGELGLDFGLWFEPEAVNPDSDLYRAHPDWAIESAPGRNELLLDLRKAPVRDYIVENVSSVIDSAGVKYVKWDMNRHSCLLGGDAHEYILGLYDVLHRIFDSRPQVLLEGCASGGNRFDLGMLCFAPQIWASDDTDPIERLDIKQGLFNFYPQSTVGCHISASAHIQTLRETPLSTRANVSFFGIFGLELDLSHLLPVELQELKNAITFYKANRELFQFGELSEVKAEKDAAAWQVKGNGTAAVGVFHRLVHAASGYEWLYANLEEGRYKVAARPQLLRVRQFSSMIKHIAPISPNPNGVIVRDADKYYKMYDGAQSFECSGSALKAGVPMELKFTGTGYDPQFRNQGDFGSNIYLIEKTD